MASTMSNHWKYALLDAVSSDTFKIALMGGSFVYNKDSHATYADVSASELSTGNGYTAGGATLANFDLTEDDVNDKGAVTWDDVTWTASGGSIGPSAGAVVYDDTMSDDAIVGYIDFGTTRTATDGNDFTIESLRLEIA